MKWLMRNLLLFGLLAVAAPGWAATATTTFAVTGTVVPGCAVSATAMAFGASIPNPILANIDATSTVTATCATGTPWTIALSVGGGAGATFAVRRMTFGANTMTYSLFTNAARTIVWGNGTAGNVTVPGTGDGTAQPVTVFGRIPPQVVAASGAYADTITVTITF
jgi:spore coat protein U-like protein